MEPYLTTEPSEEEVEGTGKRHDDRKTGPTMIM